MKPLSKENINLFRNKARCVIRELGLLNDAYFDIDVTLSERHLLIELNTNLYPTMKEISEKLLLDKSTVSRLISKAVKRDMSNVLLIKMTNESVIFTFQRKEKCLGFV